MTTSAPAPRGAAVHTATYRVRFDEAGPQGRLRTSGLLRYTQDLAAQHSEALGYDRSWYASRGITWLVRCAEIDVGRPIPYGTLLEATTRVVGFRRVWSRRETTFALPDGETAATVRIDWVLVDALGRPNRIPPDVISLFESADGAALQLARVDLAEPAAGVHRRSFRVRPQELDPMDHVNNAVYADWADEAVGAAAGGEGVAAAVPRRVRLEYAQAAEPGARLESRCWTETAGWSILIGRAAPGPGGADALLRARIEPGGPAPDPAGGQVVDGPR